MSKLSILQITRFRRPSVDLVLQLAEGVVPSDIMWLAFLGFLYNRHGLGPNPFDNCGSFWPRVTHGEPTTEKLELGTCDRNSYRIGLSLFQYF